MEKVLRVFAEKHREWQKQWDSFDKKETKKKPTNLDEFIKEFLHSLECSGSILSEVEKEIRESQDILKEYVDKFKGDKLDGTALEEYDRLLDNIFTAQRKYGETLYAIVNTLE